MAFTIVQLSDPHLGAPWDPDPADALSAAVDAVQRTLPADPDAVILTGDVANTPADAEYEQARRLLDRLSAPVFLLSGNHDDGDALRRHFDLPGSEQGHLSYVADLGPVRLVMLDSQDPGQVGGRLDDGRLQWLDGVLDTDPATPILLALHHPPIETGLPAMDAIGIPLDQRRALDQLLARHRHVQLIVAGHVHRTIVGVLSEIRVLAIPGTALQIALDFEAQEPELVREPPCFALHLVAEGQLVSHVQPIADLRTAAQPTADLRPGD